MSRFLLLTLLLVQCGGGNVDTKPVEPPPSTGSNTQNAPVVHQELGSIDDRAVSNTFQDLGNAFQACQTAGLKRLPFLAGGVKFFLRVGEDGRTRWTYLEESTLGDYDTERCLLDAVEGTQWPKPIGGEATVERDLSFDPDSSRQPSDWSADRVAATLGAAKGRTGKCTEAAPNTSFKVTAYVEPHAKAGRVVAAGVAVSNKEGAPHVKCVVDAVKELSMPSPGSFAAKVSFTL